VSFSTAIPAFHLYDFPAKIDGLYPMCPGTQDYYWYNPLRYHLPLDDDKILARFSGCSKDHVHRAQSNRVGWGVEYGVYDWKVARETYLLLKAVWHCNQYISERHARRLMRLKPSTLRKRTWTRQIAGQTYYYRRDLGLGWGRYPKQSYRQDRLRELAKSGALDTEATPPRNKHQLADRSVVA